MKKMKDYFSIALLPLLIIIIMAGCEDRIGVTSPKPITIPTVSSTSPTSVSISVSLNTIVTATFSEAMNSSTITTATFTLMQGTSFVSGTVSYSGTTATFAPSSSLSANTAYTATITTGAQGADGTAMANNYVWNFTTSASNIISPMINSTNPVDAATNVPINQKIAANFSIAMDASTITTSTFILVQGLTSVSGFVSYSGTTAIFTPASNLAPNTTYTVTVSSSAKNLAGTPLSNNFVWSFTTGATAVITAPTINSTDPANAATNIPFNQKVAATFSTTMDASTITTSTFTLLQGTTPVTGFVSYSGTTAIFAPSNNLSPNTAYTATITTGAKNLAGTALANYYVWNFTTGAAAVITPPTISFTDPANTATGVPLNQKIAATFSKTMDASTFTTPSFTLSQGTTSITGFVSYSGVTAIFAPASNLTPNTVYTATITTGVKDLAGNALANNYVWTFTTGATALIIPPAIVSTDPMNAATGVPLNQKIAATFSKTMDASTFTTPTFTLMQGTNSVSGFISYSGSTAIFAPANYLTPNTIYTATITTAAKDLSGNALANNYVWSFTTGAAAVVIPPTVISTDPANAATGVALTKQIAANFSTIMDASTFTSATFTLVQGTTSISGFTSYSGTTAVFAPASNLAPNTIYTATITTGVKDLAGNALVSNYIWSFTTGASAVVIPPTIISTNPLNGATGVPFNKQIAATFSKTMDASTITSATYTLMQGTSSVSGTVSYIGMIATFIPTINLIQNTTYTATITTAAKDLTGISMVSNYVWSFQTSTSTYTVALSSNPLAGGTTNGSGTFNSGSSVSVSATPNAGYVFTNWIENGIPVSINANYTFTISGNRTLQANFSAIQQQYTVTLSANPLAGGTVTQSGTGTYNSGSSVTVTAIPYNGYTFSSWKENGNVITGANASYTFIISGNRTLEADFAISSSTGNLLGSASTFGIMATAAITNTGLSTINGDVSLDPGTSMTGFPPGKVNGSIHINDLVSAQARADLLVAYNYFKNLPPGTTISGGADLGALYPLGIPPGTYTSGSTMLVSTPLVLDAKGDPNAVWVFQIGSSLTTGASVSLTNGAQAKNVYWVPTLDATIGVGTIFYGTIVSGRDVTAVTGATINGRILAGATTAGTIALQSSTVNVP